MTATELNERYGMPGVLRFEQHEELTRAMITLPSCEATIYLQGAHLTHWQPNGEKPVLFLSEKAVFAKGKAIRGGVPLCFPWFGSRADGGPGPSHGFARIQPWELSFAALLPDRGEGERLQLTFVLAPTQLSESLGFHDFRVAYEVMLGRTLSLKLTVANFGNGALRFEEALHTYFAVGDVRESEITGLEAAAYLDKRDDSCAKTLANERLVLREWTDRVFLGNRAASVIHDRLDERSLINDKANSATTVVWNPWPEGAAGFPDLGSDEWPLFLCVETANTGTDAITLASGQTHAMRTTISVRKVT